MAEPRQPRVALVGVDCRTAGLGALETLHRSRKERGPAEIGSSCGGVVELLTCHRVELYVETPRLGSAELLEAWRSGGAPLPEHAVRVANDRDVGRHLLRVSAGLESAVLGEDQIQGQVRAAYRAACAEGHPGPLLHRLFHAAFRAGKRVRSETALGQGGRSLAGSAVNEVEARLGGLRKRCVLVLGAGEMASVAVRRLRDRGVGRLLITNRTQERATALANAHGGEVLPWRWRERTLSSVDAVICATGAPEPVISADDLLDAGRPAIAIDLAIPRNLRAPTGPGARLRILDLEALGRRLEAVDDARRRAVAAAEEIVEEELEAWWSWVESRRRAHLVPGRCRKAAG